MRVGLFIPCYINQLYPKVAIATLELLEKLGLKKKKEIDSIITVKPVVKELKTRKLINIK